MNQSLIKPSPQEGGKKTVENIPQKTGLAGKTAKQIVRRHIRDKNDVITEEDIKYVKIDLGIPKDKAHKPLPISNDTERPKDEDKDNKIMTPWDVISE